MRKLITLSTTMFALCITSFSQEKSNNGTTGLTSFYAEVGGPGILFSANLDRRFTRSHLGLGGRIGVGFVTAYEEDTSTWGGWGDQVSVVTVPVQINYIFGKGKSPHTFEVGAGITYIGRKLELLNFYDDKTSQLFGTFSFMYRRQPPDGGFTWRIGFTPLVANGYIQPFGSAGVGFNF